VQIGTVAFHERREPAVEFRYERGDVLHHRVLRSVVGGRTSPLVPFPFPVGIGARTARLQPDGRNGRIRGSSR
jgi:hypothetical protein